MPSPCTTKAAYWTRMLLVTPQGRTTIQSGRKGSIAFADLRALGPYPILNPDASGIYQIDRLVGWRNYATTQPSNNVS